VNVAVCIRPGTELSFAEEVRCLPTGLIPWRGKTIAHKTAIFRQINKAHLMAHHDALEFPDGQIVLLTALVEDQSAAVLQLPAKPKTASDAEAQERVANSADRQRSRFDLSFCSPRGRERCYLIAGQT
jgi:hypothetical protein